MPLRLTRLGLSALMLITAGLGCGPIEDEADAGPDGGSGMRTDFSFPDAGGGGLPDAAPSTPMPWVVVRDQTEGIGLTAWFGADVDAVGWSCNGGPVAFANRVEASQRGEATGFPIQTAEGRPDGPCEPPTACAAPLGVAGWIALRGDAADLTGCEATVYEVPDAAEERFEVHLCPTGEFTLDCIGPVFTGADGDHATGTLSQ